jgi:putative transposase
MVAIDVYSRRIIGYAVQKFHCAAPSVCCMFNEILAMSRAAPKRISTDNDPLFEFHRWESNLRIAEIKEIKTVPENAFYLHLIFLHNSVRSLG